MSPQVREHLITRDNLLKAGQVRLHLVVLIRASSLETWRKYQLLRISSTKQGVQSD